MSQGHDNHNFSLSPHAGCRFVIKSNSEIICLSAKTTNRKTDEVLVMAKFIFQV